MSKQQANAPRRCKRRERGKKMRRVYIDVKHARNIRTVAWQCCKLNCVEQLPPIRLAIEKAGTHTSPVTSSHLNRVIKRMREREENTHIERDGFLLLAKMSYHLTYTIHNENWLR